jgi:hypothetical protein
MQGSDPRLKSDWSDHFSTIPDGTDHGHFLILLPHQHPEVMEVAKTLANELTLTPDEQYERDAVR